MHILTKTNMNQNKNPKSELYPISANQEKPKYFNGIEGLRQQVN
jgi:hypothetical protein